MKKCDSDADPLERARGAHKSTPATDSKYSSVVCLSRPEIGETQIERRVFGARGRVVLESTVSIEAEAALFLQHSPPRKQQCPRTLSNFVVCRLMLRIPRGETRLCAPTFFRCSICTFVNKKRFFFWQTSARL